MNFKEKDSPEDKNFHLQKTSETALEMIAQLISTPQIAMRHLQKKNLGSTRMHQKQRSRKINPITIVMVLQHLSHTINPGLHSEQQKIIATTIFSRSEQISP